MEHHAQEQKNAASFAFIPAIISMESARISCGTRFVVSADNGDIVPRERHHGFYAHDTRFLSQFTVTVNGKRLNNTGHATFEDRMASFYCTAGQMSIVRDRNVSQAFHEDISITNNGLHPVNVNLEIGLGADFADVFEVRRGTVHKAGNITMEQSGPEGLTISYRRENYLRATRIRFTAPVKMKGNVAHFEFQLMPKDIWRTCIDVSPVMDGHEHRASACVSEILGKPFGSYQEKTYLGFFQEVETGMPLEKVPSIKTDNPDLAQAYHRTIGDLRALRLPQQNGDYVLAAGLPWFMALFGRDSIISAIQTKMLGPELMIGTLHTLAGLQATGFDKFREAEPGKIIHEIRRGELSLFGNVPHTRYYGSVDATPLFIMLLWEAYLWTGDVKILEDMLPYAELAMGWIEKYGDVDNDGFTEYKRRISKGLINQGWKDSYDSISFNDGTLAHGPIALCEEQGYVYAAKKSLASANEVLGNFKRADELLSSAGKLKKQFNQAFWMPEHGFYAIALDGKKQPVDSISSNPGHCLWTGIVDEDKAAKVAQRLMAPDVFSGWGVRTLSSEAKRYNPLSYHNGSIWPHDNSIVAAGLRRYGFYQEAVKIAMAVIEATAVLPSHRLPELYAGYTRRAYSFPVPYPTANSPQAWASGSIIYLLETMLEITPEDEQLVSGPLVKASPMFTLKGVRYKNREQSLP
jgi:glycogen debranching enzyme